MESEPEKLESNRNPDGTFREGQSGNPKGRPKGKTIKEMVKEYLEEHPDDMRAFVQHFVKKNRELAWQMMEGSPGKAVDVTSGGKPIPILGNVPIDDSHEKDSGSQETN